MLAAHQKFNLRHDRRASPLAAVPRPLYPVTVDDLTCVEFLKWALPRMSLRWEGVRRVRRQVCKRIGRRLRVLELADVDAYRDYLGAHADEWRELDGLCRISVSRFFRDAEVFAHLGQAVLPELARCAAARGESRLRCWSAGCASGEEPYSLSIVWALEAASRSPRIELEVVATDADPHLLERARAARYRAGTLRELPPGWRERAFAPAVGLYALDPKFRRCVSLLRQDIRTRAPPGRFDVVLCRNLAFTYFAAQVQDDVGRRIARALVAGGALVIGVRERLPRGAGDLAPWGEELGVYRKSKTFDPDQASMPGRL